MPIVFRNIESERVRLGLTVKEISEILEVTRQTYAKQIRGQSSFSIPQLKILNRVTGKSIDYLLQEYNLIKGDGDAIHEHNESI